MNDKQTNDKTVSQLLSTALPLMITWLSTTVMLFVDRLFLAKFSLEALGAAVHAGTIAWGFAYGFQMMVEMAQVVVAQYQGAKQSEKLGVPPWQMIWLVLGSFLAFIPLAIWGGAWFFADPTHSALQGTYFRWLIVFGPVFGLIGATSSFFIGRGDTKIITWASLIGNITNIVLDWFLIFGIEGVIPPMGVKGAALATGIGMTLQALLLLGGFLHKRNRTQYGTNQWRWKGKVCWQCLRVGLPSGFFISVEFLGWGVFYSMMAKASEKHLLITSICQTLLPLLVCFSIGLQKGVASLCGKLIGAGQLERLPRVLGTGLLLFGIYSLITTGLLALYPDPIIGLFLGPESGALESALRTGLILSSGYLFFGGIRSLIVGALSAAGDSVFLTIGGALPVWVFLLLPTYYFVVVGGASVEVAQSLLVVYGLVLAVLHAFRFWQGRWKSGSLLIEPANQ